MSNIGLFTQIGLGVHNATNVENPLLTHDILRVVVCPAPKSFSEGLTSGLQFWNTTKEWFLNPMLPLALPDGVGELFGYRLSKAAGVRVPLTKLLKTEPKKFTEHFIKPVTGGWICSKRVAASMPVYYLSDLVETYPKARQSRRVEKQFHEFHSSQFHKRCPVDRAMYSDFPISPSQEVLAAARWDSPQRIVTYAYRAFLWSTYPHTSNVLVDTKGRLWLIDHEKILYRGDTDDIRQLHGLVKDHGQIMKACRQVAKITCADIRKALSGIDERYWQGGVFNDEWSAGEYFIERLAAWKSAFK